MARARDPDRPAVDQDLSAGQPVGSEERPRDLGAAAANETGQADDFAGAHLQRNVLDSAGPRESVRFEQQGRVRRRRLLGRSAHVEAASDHRRHQRLGRLIAGRARADQPAVAHHRDVVAHLKHLLEVVRHEHDACAALGQRADDAQEVRALVGRQGRSWLVHENQHARRARSRAGSRPSAARRSAARRRVRSRVDRNRCARRAGVQATQVLVSNDAEVARLDAEEDVLEHGACGNQRDLLGDGCDARRQGVAW